MRQLNGAVIASRAARLREKGVEALRRHLVNAKGRHIQVLMESEGRGRAGDFTPVKIEAEEGAPKLIDAVVNGHDGSALIARTLA
jgi:threonylcarbamoyladenosine tRNA methylthiotransferase MtaB